jgi:hypothetical protein
MRDWLKMDLAKFAQLREILPEDRFMLCYSGFVSESVLEAVGGTLKERLNLHISEKKKIKVVFSIFVELMQNLIRYGDSGPKGLQIPDEDRTGFGMLMIIEDNDGSISLLSGNYVSPEEKIAMESRLERLLGRSHDELRDLMKEQMRKPPEINSKGASLGLIEIARRSTRPIEASFVPSSNSQHFFSLKAYV